MGFSGLKIDVEFKEPEKVDILPPSTPLSTMPLASIMSQTATKKVQPRKVNNLNLGLQGKRQKRGMGMMFR